MHITVHCPSCRSRYQLNEDMRGKRMRCPNAICRQVFEVREEPAEPAPGVISEPPPSTAAPATPRRPPTPPEKQYAAGTVGEIVPFLTSEAAEASPPEAGPLLAAAPVSPAPTETPSWQQAPPIRRRPADAAPTLPPEPPTSPELPRWQQAPPPVRKAADTFPKARNPKGTLLPAALVPEAITPAPPKPPEPGEVAAKAVTAEPSEKEPSVPVRRSTAKRAMLVMVLLVLAVAGAGIWYGTAHEAQTEAELVEKAKEANQNGDFVKAVGLYDQLIKNFAESDDIGEYRFLKDLCGVRRDVARFDVEAKAAFDRLRDFTARYAEEPLLMSHQKEVWDTYQKLIDDKLVPTDIAEKIAADNFIQVENDLKNARAAQRDYAKFASDDAPAKLEKRFEAVQSALDRFQLVRGQVDQIRSVKTWTWTLYQEIDKENKRLGLEGHKEVSALMNKAGLAVLFENNRYYPHEKGPALRPPAEDTAHSLLVASRLDPPGGPQRNADGVVFALARGVLYALRERDGHVLWFVRVGIDTSTLPVRLPKSQANPRELVLVLSSDTNTLTARDALTGQAQWQYTLSAACLGRPVLDGKLAYVPTIDGRVHEIEIVGGHVLGEFRLSLGLSGAGARQESTGLLYFPADKEYIYVLDVKKKRCVAMLHTGHPSGSLRGDPIIVSDDGAMPVGGERAPPRYLILSMADGLDAMRLRAYRLPIEGLADMPPLQPEPRVRGWSWFQPACDGEKVVLTTDAGVLGLFGINQYQNQDQPLFPIFPREIELEGDPKRVGRAQVVHVADQDYWALAQGNLQQWRMGLGPAGLKAAAVWTQPLPLGSPLHAAQVSKNGDTLFTVTQSPARQACLATAVEASTGTVRWQRQLGLMIRDELLPLAGRVIALDQGGGLFVFDPEKDNPVIPPPRGESSAPATHLLPSPDNKSVYVLASPGPGKLTIRRHKLLKKSADNDPIEISLPAPLAGTPALGGGFLVMPLANGVLARQALTAKTGGVDYGLHWRAPHADAGARGHVVYLGDQEFLLSDGSTGLLCVSWPEKQAWSVKAEIGMDNRIVTAPLLLPSDMAPRICIAEAAGNLVLLDAIKLKPIRRWPLEGKITAGPFRRGKQIGCIVDRRTLVWLDPGQTQPLWKYTVQGDGIVGQPRLVGDSVVVADFSGHFVALDAETGQPRGPGYTLKASVAPAATPVAFGPDGIFAPLTDGTILLLTREQLGRR